MLASLVCPRGEVDCQQKDFEEASVAGATALACKQRTMGKQKERQQSHVHSAHSRAFEDHALLRRWPLGCILGGAEVVLSEGVGGGCVKEEEAAVSEEVISSSTPSNSLFTRSASSFTLTTSHAKSRTIGWPGSAAWNR